MSEKRLNVRLPAEEHAQWVALAASRGQTISELIRQAVASEAVTRKPSRQVKTTKADPALLAALAKIGANINQLARLANQHGQLPTLTHLAAIERALQGLRDAG